jgi:hypothetical protein
MIDFYDIGAALLRDEPPYFSGALQSVIDQVNKILVGRAGDPLSFAPAVEESAWKARRRMRFMHFLPGVVDRPARLEPTDHKPGFTPAAVLRMIGDAHAQRDLPVPVALGVPPARLAVGGRAPGGEPPGGQPHPRAPSVARPNSSTRASTSERMTGTEFLRLVAQAGPQMRGDHGLSAALILPQEKRPQGPGAAAHSPGQGGPGRAREAQRGARGRPDAGAMMDVWRRIKTPAQAGRGDAPFAGVSGSGVSVISAIVTATLAAQQAQNQPVQDAARQTGMLGATPDAPLYTRMVPDHPAVAVQVTNADALTGATIDTLARHQGALPTAPTGLNNNLVPPAPGVPSPGSYHP